MPTSKSAEKRMRQAVVRTDRNRAVRSRLRTFINHFEKAIVEGDFVQAELKLRSVESELDSAAKKGVIPAARASRKTSRMSARLDALRSKG